MTNQPAPNSDSNDVTSAEDTTTENSNVQITANNDEIIDPNRAQFLKRLEWVHIAIIVAVFVAAGLSWAKAPDRIPVHWNLKGEVDRYGGKFEGLLLMPLIIVGLYFFLRFIPKIDPGQENYKQFEKTFAWIRFATTALMAAIHGAVISTALGLQFDMSKTVACLVGGLFLVFGNLMGKIRPNWFVGIRTPWTLSSKLSWTKTHRVGGWVFCGMGVGILLTGLVQSSWVLITVLVGSGIAILGLVIYSWLVWKNDPDRVPPANTLPGDSVPE